MKCPNKAYGTFIIIFLNIYDKTFPKVEIRKSFKNPVNSFEIYKNETKFKSKQSYDKNVINKKKNNIKILGQLLTK